MQGTGHVSVTAVVPAFNEGETLAEVLIALRRAPLVDDVLVVSDGSTDDTVEVARRAGVRAIHLKVNWGKGIALATGVAHTDSPILLFIDADLMHVTEQMLESLVSPVTRGRVGMNIGIRHRGALLDTLHRHTGPLLSGVRCLRREVFEAVPEAFLGGYRVETALNWACRRLGLHVRTTVLHQLKHRVKERKLGYLAGLGQRCLMFAVVFSAWLKLKVAPPPPPGHASLHLPELEYINF